MNLSASSTAPAFAPLPLRLLHERRASDGFDVTVDVVVFGSAVVPMPDESSRLAHLQ
jgi:hypothetical protein